MRSSLYSHEYGLQVATLSRVARLSGALFDLIWKNSEVHLPTLNRGYSICPLSRKIPLKERMEMLWSKPAEMAYEHNLLSTSYGGGFASLY
jgi:hypothetical protein